MADSEMTMTDLEIVVNGILCAESQRSHHRDFHCEHCDFHCAKWLPKERSKKQIAVIEDIIKRWRESLMSDEKTQNIERDWRLNDNGND